MKHVFGTVAFLVALAGVANAQLTIAKTADEWGTIQPAGPRPATSGNRFWNIEGASFGDFASTGTLRFYLQDVVARFDAAYGIGGWEVSNIRIVLEHDDAGFSVAGGVDVYQFSNDDLALTNGDNSDGDPGDFGDLRTSDLFF